MNTIPKFTQLPFNEFLEFILKQNSMQVLHKTAKKTLFYRDILSKLSVINKESRKDPLYHENSIILDTGEFKLTEGQWIMLHKLLTPRDLPDSEDLEDGDPEKEEKKEQEYDASCYEPVFTILRRDGSSTVVRGFEQFTPEIDFVAGRDCILSELELKKEIIEEENKSSIQKEHYKEAKKHMDLINDEVAFPKNPKLLYNKIRNIFQKIDDKSKENKSYVSFFIEIRSMYKYDYYMHDCLMYHLMIGQREQTGIKRASFNIKMSEALLGLIIHNKPYFNSLRKVIEQNNHLGNDLGEKRFLELILLHKIDTKEIEDLREEQIDKHRVYSKLIFKFLYYTFKKTIYKQYKNNNFKNIKTKEWIEKIITSNKINVNEEYIDANNNYTSTALQIGDYFTNLLVSEGVLIDKLINNQTDSTTNSDDLELETKDDVIDSIINKKKTKNQSKHIKDDKTKNKKSNNLKINQNFKKNQPYKEYHMLEPSPEIIHQLMNMNVYNKPFLIKEQLDESTHFNNETGYYRVIQENMKEFIHQNPKIVFEIKPSSYLNKMPQTLYTKYSVYQSPLKVQLGLIAFYSLHLGGKLEEDTFIGSLYELDVERYYKLCDIPQIGNIVSLIWNEGLDFSRCLSSKQLFGLIHTKFGIKLDKVKIPYHVEVVSMLFEICQRKYQYINLLKESILYSMFNHIIYTSFIDSRGRKYNNAGSTSLQNHHLAKSIIRLTDPGEGVRINDTFIAIIAHHLQEESLKIRLDHLNRKDGRELINSNWREIRNYIQSLLNNSFEEVTEFIVNPYYQENPLSLFNALKPKKVKNHLLVHSVILYEQERYLGQRPAHFANYVEKDATSSGLQMISILFQSPSIAQCANLIISPNNTSYDIYTDIKDQCHKFYKEILMLSEDVRMLFEINENQFSRMKLHYWEMPENFFQSMNDYSDSELMLLWMVVDLNIDLCKPKRKEKNKKENNIKDKYKTSEILFIQTLLNKFINLENKPNKSHFYYYWNQSPRVEFIEKLYTFLDDKMKQLFEELKDIFGTQTYLLKLLFCIRYALRITCVSKARYPFIEKDIWQSRNLFKKAVMTYFYSSTYWGRFDDYLEYFRTVGLIADLDKARVVLSEFISFLDKFFISYLHSIPQMTLMDKFIDRVMEKHINYDKIKPIIISNNNFKIQIEPFKTKTYQIQCPGFNRKRGHQLSIKRVFPQIDEQKLRTMFGANLIHSMDSTIVHYLIEIVFDINKMLERFEFPHRLIFETNHDCFICNYPLLLSLLVEECYHRLINEHYIRYISNLSREDYDDFTTKHIIPFRQLTIPLNPNFIKF